MTQEEVIRMMQSACDKDKVPAWHNEFWTITQDELERFAALVAAAERRCEDECPACDARMIEVEQARVDALARSYENGYYAGVNAEREACAALVETLFGKKLEIVGSGIAAEIRARGKQE